MTHHDEEQREPTRSAALGWARAHQLDIELQHAWARAQELDTESQRAWAHAQELNAEIARLSEQAQASAAVLRNLQEPVVEQQVPDPAFNRFRPYTMIGDGRLNDLTRDVHYVFASRIPGAFVECGVWRGGASFLMADLIRRRGVHGRKVWMFDSFEGLPPATAPDGQPAADYQADPDGPWFFNNCTASLEEVQQAAEHLGLTPYVEMVKGWFDKTLPSHRTRIGQIALLRIDADWYESVKCCLEQLYDQVAPGGLIILDDYYDWQGCAIATHEFLGRRKIPFRIKTQDAGGAAVIYKASLR